MKTTIKLAIATVAILLYSCSSNFIDLTDPGKLTSEQFYKTPEQIEFAVSGIYSSMQVSNYIGNWYVFSEIPSDNTRNTLSGSVTDQDEFDKYYIRTLNPFTANFWNQSYAAINKANTVLGKLPESTVEASIKSRFEREAKFLRAFFYFSLLRVFGDVPLITKEVTIEESYGYLRETTEKVYEQIVADLTDASTLPDSYTGANIGRATSGAAKTLLGLVYLTRREYTKAAPLLKQVIESGKYRLIENTNGSLNNNGYKSVFDPANHNHSESIFDIQYKKGGFGEGSGFANSFAPENSGTNVVTVGGTSGNNIPEESMFAVYEEGDLRRDFSMATGYNDSRTGGTFVYAPHVRKYLDIPYASGDSNNNWLFLRYADVLLMYAECLIESNDLAGAMECMNQVRRRGFGYQSSNVGSPVDLFATTKDESKLLVEKERRVELAFEGHRWFDLIRTGRAVAVMTAFGKKVNSTNIICPIPQKQIDLNDKITQNIYTIEPR